jgi:hypothetical protein
MPLELSYFKGFYSFLDFSSMCAAIAHGLWLININDLQIKFEDGCYQLFFLEEFLLLELNHFKGKCNLHALDFTLLGTFFPQMYTAIALKLCT